MACMPTPSCARSRVSPPSSSPRATASGRAWRRSCSSRSAWASARSASRTASASSTTPRCFPGILESHGFDVVSVACKHGSIPKEEVGLSDAQKVRPGQFEALCNPVSQARAAERAWVRVQRADGPVHRARQPVLQVREGAHHRARRQGSRARPQPRRGAAPRGQLLQPRMGPAEAGEATQPSGSRATPGALTRPGRAGRRVPGSGARRPIGRRAQPRRRPGGLRLGSRRCGLRRRRWALERACR